MWTELLTHVGRGRGSESTALKRLHRAIALANLGRVDEALEDLSHDVLVDPAQRKLFRQLAVQAAARGGRLGDAVRLAGFLAGAEPKSAEDIALFGNFLIRSGRPQEGALELETAGRLRPDDVDIACRRIRAQIGIAAFAQAAQLARQYVSHAPRMPQLAKQCLLALTREKDPLVSDLLSEMEQWATLPSDLAVTAAKSAMEFSLPRLAIIFAEKATGLGELSSDLHLIKAQAHLSLHEALSARDQIEAVVRLKPEDLKLAAECISLCLRAGMADEAAALARRYVKRCYENPRLLELSMLALARAGDAAAAEIIFHMAGSGTLTASRALLAARYFIRLKRFQDAITICRQTIDAGHVSARLHLALAQALILSGESFERAVEQLEAARDLEPDDPAVLKILGRLKLGLGRFEDAAEILKEVVDLAPGGRNIFLLARALRFSRRYQEAADVLLSRNDDLGVTKNWRRQATAALLHAGREDEAASLYSDLIELRSARLATDFRSHLQNLPELQEEDKIPEARIDWAWNTTCRLAGAPPAEGQAAWEEKARWGFRADRAILDWLECRPERVGEILDFLPNTREEVKPLLQLLDAKKGALVAGAHIGPMYAGPIMMYAGGVPFKVVAQMPRISAAAYSSRLISTCDKTELDVAKEIVSALNKGMAVLMTVDAAMSPASPRVSWEGVSVGYSDFAPALVYRKRVPSIFACSYWKDGTIHFGHSHLPSPGEDETQESFLARWRDAYFAELSAYFKYGAENLRLAEGVWRYVN
ncbi:hypothetical protein CWB41_07300 [Methylovirgula ligni]|nr:hypothetical protein CWB41_07300 [Methylovirgula ligni]